MRYLLSLLLALWAIYIASGLSPFNQFPWTWKLPGGIIFMVFAVWTLVAKASVIKFSVPLKALLWFNFVVYSLNSTPDRDFEVQPTINPYLAYGIVTVFTLCCFLLCKRLTNPTLVG